MSLPESTISPDVEDPLANLLALSESKSFIAHEFLIWLWFRSEKNPTFKIDIAESGTHYSAEIWVEDHIKLEHLAEEQTQTFRGGNPSDCLEAGVALANGKHVREIRLGIDIEHFGTYRFTLSGGASSHIISPKSLVLPEIDTNQEQDSGPNLSIRINQTQAFLTVIDKIFGQFLELRLRSDWEKKGLGKIYAWINDRKLEKTDPLH